eukprot:jgi/Bigna1/72775/fgenesh1_pg.21_\
MINWLLCFLFRSPLLQMKDSHRDEEETFKNLIEFLRKQKPVSRLRMSFVLSKGPKKLKTCFNQCAKMQCDNVCAIETKDPFPDYTNEYHSWNRMHVSTRLTAMLVRHGRCADIMDFGGKSATDILARLLTIGSQETCELHRKVIFYPPPLCFMAALDSCSFALYMCAFVLVDHDRREFDFVGIAECMHHKTGKICCLTFACRRPAHERLESKFSHYSSGGGGSRGLTSYYVNGKRRSARHNDGDAESRTAEEKLGGSGIMIDHHRRHLHHHHHHHTNKYQHQHQNISHHHHHQQQQQSNFVVAPPGTPEQHPLNIVLVPPSTPNDVVSLPLSGAITGDGGGGGGEDFAEIRDVIAKARNTIPPPGKQDTLLAAEDKEGGLADSADDGSSVGAVAAAIPEVVATPDRVGTPEAALAENIDSPSSWGRREEG